MKGAVHRGFRRQDQGRPQQVHLGSPPSRRHRLRRHGPLERARREWTNSAVPATPCPPHGQRCRRDRGVQCRPRLAARQCHRRRPHRAVRARSGRARPHERGQSRRDAHPRIQGRHRREEEAGQVAGLPTCRRRHGAEADGDRGSLVSGAEQEQSGSAQFPDQVEQSSRLVAPEHRDGRRRRPTDGAYVVYKELSAELRLELDRLAAVEKNDLAALNRMAAGMGLAPIAAKTEVNP